MLKQRRAAAEKVAAGLYEAEAAVSIAIERVASLVGTIQVAHKEANLSPVTVNDAAYGVISCLRALGEGNQELIAAHHKLADAQVRIGLGAVAMGVGGGNKPTSSLASTGSADVRLVAAA